MDPHDDSLERLLGLPGPDPGCEAGFAQLERYCDAVRRGDKVERRFPGLPLVVGGHQQPAVAGDETRSGTEQLLADLPPAPAVWCSGLRKRYRRQTAVDDVPAAFASSATFIFSRSFSIAS